MVNESQLKKQLSSGQISNLYLCFGEEKMLVKRCAQLIESKISGGDLNEFNYHVFDNDADLGDIAVCADMIPFMSEWNILRINDMDIDKLSKADFDALMKIIKSASGQTVIIIATPTLEITSKTAKKQFKQVINHIDKNGVCIELTHRTGLMLERDLCKWAKAGGCSMSELTAHALIQYAGEDLNRLNAEMKKLTAYADGGEITSEMIELLVSKTAEASVYDLSTRCFISRSAACISARCCRARTLTRIARGSAVKQASPMPLSLRISATIDARGCWISSADRFAASRHLHSGAVSTSCSRCRRVW